MMKSLLERDIRKFSAAQKSGFALVGNPRLTSICRSKKAAASVIRKPVAICKAICRFGRTAGSRPLGIGIAKFLPILCRHHRRFENNLAIKPLLAIHCLDDVISIEVKYPAHKRDVRTN